MHSLLGAYCFIPNPPNFKDNYNADPDYIPLACTIHNLVPIFHSGGIGIPFFLSLKDL